MKDSRMGAYGVIGLILLLALKFFTLIELLNLDLWFCLKSLILAHVLSRFMAVTVIFTHEYAREDATSKIKPIAKKLNLKNLVVSAIWLVPAFLIFQNMYVFLALIPVYAMKIYLANYFQKWTGGYTGDCLGAIQQVTEIITLLFCLGLWKFI
jgi:adenosylcobinamide-GDP ribazoletransferase